MPTLEHLGCAILLVAALFLVGMGPILVPVYIIGPLRDRWSLRRLESWRSASSPVGDPRDAPRLLEALEALGPKHRDARFQERFELLDRICGAYLASLAEQQEEIRRFFAEREALRPLLLRFCRLSALKLEEVRSGVEGEQVLERGLAAALIEDAGTDIRDTWLVLDRLRAAAHRAGIDQEQCFREVAPMAGEHLATFMERYTGASES